ncbi:putative transcription factor & chromatin remodeling ARID family [Helianthus anomalus]
MDDKPNDTGSKSTDATKSDEKPLAETLDDANTAEEHDNNTAEIDAIANQSDSVAAVSNEDINVKYPVTEAAAAAVENKNDDVEQLENGEEHHHIASPSASGGNKNDDVEDVMEGKMCADFVVVPKMESEREIGDSFLLEPNSGVEDESGTEDEQAAFMKEVEIFHKERFLEFKPPKFYGEPLNCLKLWRSVIRLGGYEQVTSCKLWRQIGESFKPPKTCTTVSWTFRVFYEKALLEYEKYKSSIGELPFTDVSSAEPVSGLKQTSINQTPGSGRARRDAAARAMQGWHSQRLGNGEVGDPVIKDKTSSTSVKREKQGIGLLKRKKPSPVERAVKVARMKASKPQLDSPVVDVGPPADWVKINVQRTKDCFEVYALVPGLLREEVRVQSDPAGRLIISGQPEQLDNPWGVSPFKKVVSLPSRIDPHQTSAVVTLHGQLFVRVPFEQAAVS